MDSQWFTKYQLTTNHLSLTTYHSPLTCLSHTSARLLSVRLGGASRRLVVAGELGTSHQRPGSHRAVRLAGGTRSEANTELALHGAHLVEGLCTLAPGAQRGAEGAEAIQRDALRRLQVACGPRLSGCLSRSSCRLWSATTTRQSRRNEVGTYVTGQA